MKFATKLPCLILSPAPKPSASIWLPLAARLEDVDGHMTLYLVLDRVWADVWGEKFAEERVRYEANWGGEYAAAWAWAQSLSAEERSRLWNRLLVMNGFPDGCRKLPESAE